MRQLLFYLFFIFSSSAIADNGLIIIKSAHDVKTTADRLENALKTKGMTVFARINHTAGAAAVGIELRPTEVVIFGNPKVGTPLMLCSQTMAIDLPQKALIWQDKQGATWLSYNKPKYLAARHDVKGCDKVIAKIEGALANFSKQATMP